ncbi:hypothetical protein [Thalassomonas haliotis]|uniref:Uncharacterized protein n=1 Tax=Thalassomonas haliotis TaxID=485448 RepID=A0ABY7VLG6_9GAMM|nr:hypothetical protein [Thalassomonas haliotis]WDE13916.1 hypothetical protein H3N35_10990 [Thalassomonas haliotis]
MKNISSLSLLCFSILFFTWSVTADQHPGLPQEVPLPADARVFARFDDSLPAVINYFTRESEQAILALYQKRYGEPNARERKRGRLTVTFSRENTDIRIVISEQNKQRQVDILKMK